MLRGVYQKNDQCCIDRFNKRCGTIFHQKHNVTKMAAIFIGQNRNKINGISPISQYSNQAFENEEQLVYIGHIIQF